MAIINKVLNFLILIVAIAALVFGYQLFNRRAELRSHSDMLADSMANVVKELDVASERNLANEINRKDVMLSTSELGPGGKLGWAFFHDQRDASGGYEGFNTKVLRKVEDYTKDVRTQRDELANTLGEIAELFGKEEDLPNTAFQALPSYDGALTAIKFHMKQVQHREETFTARLEEIANKIGVPMEAGVLNDVANFEQPFQDLVDNIDQLNTRSTDYVNTVAKAIENMDSHEFTVNIELLKDKKGYTDELVNLHNDFSRINDKLSDFDKLNLDLLETQNTLERTVTQLESAYENAAQVESHLRNCIADRSTLKIKLSRFEGVTDSPIDERIAQNLQGQVIDVNYDWDYIIINLGKRDRLPANVEMTVARDREFICKVLVTRVLDKYAVADILPQLRQGLVVEGDRVIF